MRSIIGRIVSFFFTQLRNPVVQFESTCGPLFLKTKFRRNHEKYMTVTATNYLDSIKGDFEKLFAIKRQRMLTEISCFGNVISSFEKLTSFALLRILFSIHLKKVLNYL